MPDRPLTPAPLDRTLERIGPDVMYICAICRDEYPEGCGHFDRNAVRWHGGFAGWICETCFSDAPGDEDWDDAPRADLASPAPEDAVLTVLRQAAERLATVAGWVAHSGNPVHAAVVRDWSQQALAALAHKEPSHDRA